jgi:hypothetical protein
MGPPGSRRTVARSLARRLQEDDRTKVDPWRSDRGPSGRRRDWRPSDALEVAGDGRRARRGDAQRDERRADAERHGARIAWSGDVIPSAPSVVVVAAANPIRPNGSLRQHPPRGVIDEQPRLRSVVSTEFAVVTDVVPAG